MDWLPQSKRFPRSWPDIIEWYAQMVKIAYLVHDLADAAVQRRAEMLGLGGADVRLAGFQRRALAERRDGAIVLGQTRDGRLTARARSVAAGAASIKNLAPAVEGADAILARNLEMLLLACRAQKRFSRQARVIYECLDIHRLLCSNGISGLALRALETWLWRHTDAILTSSPGFVREYFNRRGYGRSILLIENKVLDASGASRAQAQKKKPGPPWRIGYFGMLRCRRSLDILAKVAEALEGKLQVEIRGVPSPAIFPDFDREVSRMPHVTYYGPYSGTAALTEAYTDVHFAWAIDYYEAGQNSSWLLPNRLYESLYFGAIPIALETVEVGRWLRTQRAGVLLASDADKELPAFLAALSPERYSILCGDVDRVATGDLAFHQSDCRHLVESLVSA